MIAIIHFGPLELYPPAQNFLRFINDQKLNQKLVVFTTANSYKVLSRFQVPNSNIQIIRLGWSGNKLHSLYRYLNYVYFYTLTFLLLLFFRPKRVLYYETISSFPALLYRWLWGKTVKLYVHYHEYTTPGEYRSGMRLTRWFHKLEKKFLTSANWVSHTNNYRMQLFLNDIKPKTVSRPEILPNYPSKSWQQSKLAEIKIPYKIVYAGALSLDTMYTREFARWISCQKGNLVWHIYSYNITPEAKHFLSELDAENIRLFDGIDYVQLPAVLHLYNAGVILYKGLTPNYVYNAPNKLFEYLSCNLDVWYPEEMVGIDSYRSFNNYPKVVSVDFTKINALDIDTLISRDNLQYKSSTFTYEKVYRRFYEKLVL